eukprot:4290048-Prymnesium_polylepis.1
MRPHGVHLRDRSRRDRCVVEAFEERTRLAPKLRTNERGGVARWARRQRVLRVAERRTHVSCHVMPRELPRDAT